MDKNIPLSELIRIGAKVSEPLRGDMWSRSWDNTLSTCAIGAAYMAKFGELPELRICLSAGGALWKCGANPETPVRLPLEIQERHQHSFGASRTLYPLKTAIVSLNDTYKWSREKIADWLESIGL